MSDTLIIAHRGANRDAPQNTMPAFSQACELCSDGVETDVHMTKDGHIVLCHNYTIDKTSNGSGRISDYMLNQLLNLDFGSYFLSSFENVRIPTIDDFLIFMKNKAISVINIEVKADRNREKNREIIRKTIEAAHKYRVFDRLLISSFDGKSLEEAKKIDPDCKTGLLYPSSRRFLSNKLYPPIFYAKKIGAYAIHPHSGYVDRLIVNEAHKLGLKVNVWTVNSLKRASELMKIGVDGLITDCPFELRAVVTKSH